MAKSTARIALISGGNKGIGCEVARQLGKAGVTGLLGEAVGGTRFSRSTALEGQ
jgi:NAD(P)-dependent dehydrogenase (short-subunit alcohol dehydrogenase family)